MISKDELLAALGSFYEDIPELQSILEGLLVIQDQIDISVDELVNSMSRKEIDVFNRVLHKPLEITDGEQFPSYNSGLLYDDAGAYDYKTPTTKHQLPANIVDAEYVSDGITKHTFKSDVKDGMYEVPLGTTKVWVHGAKVDNNQLYHQFGYALGLEMPSSEEYKTMINALSDSLVNGPSEGSLMLAISAMTGIPVINNSEETIIDITPSKVTTDKATYDVLPEETITVKKGQTLQKGTPITDSIDVNGDVPGIELTRGMTGLCKPVLIPNEERNVKVSTEDGLTRLDIDGIDTDFLDELHRRGKQLHTQVTDPCVLHSLRDIIGDIQENEEPVEPTENEGPTGGGLTPYIRFNRFA